MTYSSCLTEEDQELVLDPSVVINLLATGHSAAILKALGMSAVATDNVVREIAFGSSSGRPEVEQLRAIIDDRLLLVSELEGIAMDTFFRLVSGRASESLGDGEAATIAFAHAKGCSAAIDEKKATRLAADRFDSVRLVTTIDILSHGTIQASLGDARLADATFNALQLARMQVREQQFSWVARLIGPERVDACSSLRRLARRKPAARTMV
jgi:predicted nucleic acid-binding protein